VFPNWVGKSLDPADLNHEFWGLLAKAGLPARRLHDLRHGALSLLAALGVHPKVAQAIAGHSSLALTMQVYTHVSDGLAADALAKVDALLSGAGG
jgi:integrase